MLKKYAPIEITYGKLNNFDMEDAKERMKHFVVYMKKAGDKIDMNIYMKKDYDKFMEAYLKKISNKPEIHGSTASPGKISGYVRICNTKEDIMNFKKGEILVASMTRPDSVPAMKKAIGKQVKNREARRKQQTAQNKQKITRR